MGSIMKRYFKTYRNYGSAKKQARNRPVIQIGPIFVVGNWESLDSVSIIGPDNMITSHITLRSLDKLGNGNHARGQHENKCKTFV